MMTKTDKNKIGYFFFIKLGDSRNKMGGLKTMDNK